MHADEQICVFSLGGKGWQQSAHSPDKTRHCHSISHLLHPGPAQVCILLHDFACALLQGVHMLKPALLPFTAVISLQTVQG